MFGIAGDDLTVVLFFIGLAATFAVAAMSQAGWKHRAFIIILFSIAVFFMASGISWPWLKDLSPELREIAIQVTSNPVSWLSVMVLGLSAVLFINKTTPEHNKTESGGSSRYAPASQASELPAKSKGFQYFPDRAHLDKGYESLGKRNRDLLQ